MTGGELILGGLIVCIGGGTFYITLYCLEKKVNVIVPPTQYTITEQPPPYSE